MAEEVAEGVEVIGESPAPVTEEQQEEVKEGLSETKEETTEEKPQGTQKKHAKAEDRINFLWKKNKEKEVLLAEKEKRIKELEAKVSKPPDVVSQRPKRENFDTEEAYLDAHEKYLDSRLEQRFAEREAKTTHEKQVQQEQAGWSDFERAASKLDSEEYPDLDKAILGEGVMYSGFSREFVRTTPVAGPEIAYYLYKNPDKAEQIANLPLAQQSEALIKLRDDIVKTKATKKTSDAPEPLKTLGGKSGTANKRPEDMTDNEFDAWRRAQVKARAR